MQLRHFFLAWLVAMTAPAWGYAQPVCVAAPLSDQQVKNLVDKARAARTDLAAPFPEFRWTVRRQGCHYVYTEIGLPETPEYRQFIKLNQHGAVVDTDAGNLKCPEKVFTESELADIVKAERAKRSDLPKPFPKSRTRVDRLRCTYLYFEYAEPEQRGNYQAFTIDPLGEVMEVVRPQPY